MRRTTAMRVVLVLVLWASAGCQSSGRADEAGSTVRTLVLPEMTTELPNGEGRALVVGSCATCHSARYLLDQPQLTRKAWTASVDKMIKIYGAPVGDQSKGLIVDYLVATHGREE